MVDLTLSNIKSNPQILEFIRQTDVRLNAIKYTDHGRRHAQIVSDRAMMIARKAKFSEEEIEYSGISGFCHDMGNFLDRTYHHFWSSMLFHQTFSSQTEDIEGLAAIMQAIANHDKEEIKLTNRISAALIIADKSDVHRDRVREKDKERILENIHDRVNYSVTKNDLDINSDMKIISLLLDLDTKFTALMDYFQIFWERMDYCRKSAEYLGYQFKLVINNTQII